MADVLFWQNTDQQSTLAGNVYCAKARSANLFLLATLRKIRTLCDITDGVSEA